MCNIGNAIARAFTPPGTGGLIASEEQAQQQAATSEATANQALTTAIANATAAATPVLDNPSALAANQQQTKRLLAQQGAAWSLGGAPTVAPTVATRALLGA